MLYELLADESDAINEWEMDFLQSMSKIHPSLDGRPCGPRLTPKQHIKLEQIHGAVFK